MKRVHLIITGDVQGVGFRAWVRTIARELGLTGWVKNREDGAVEIVAEGKRTDLEDFVATCQRGSDVAWVANVDITWEEATNKFVRFDIVY